MVNKIENAFYGKAKKKKLSSNEVVMSGSDKAEYDKGYKAGYGGQSAGSSSMDSWFYAGWTNGREDKRIEGYKNSFQNGVDTYEKAIKIAQEKVRKGMSIEDAAYESCEQMKIPGKSVDLTMKLKKLSGTYKPFFQNGVAKAEQEIMNKASQVGVKLENYEAPRIVYKGKKYDVYVHSNGRFELRTKEGYSAGGEFNDLDDAKKYADDIR